MPGLNVASQQTPVGLNALIERPLSGSEHDWKTRTSVLEQHGIPPGVFSWFWILERPLSRFLQSHSFTEHPTSCNGHGTDQHPGGISTHAHLWFRILVQDLIRFLVHDAHTKQPSFASGNETPAEQNGTPFDSASWFIPPAALYHFLKPYAGPASELPSSANGHEIPAEQNDEPTDASLLLIPAESLSQFLQLYEVLPKPSFDSGHETPAVQQLEDGNESDPAPWSVTPTQSQDSDDEADAQPDEATSPIPYSCPVCYETFDRVQERNRHLGSYLPHSILCPFQGCRWTGRRQWDFKRHWRKKHPEAGQTPGKDANEIYDPKDFVKLIADGTPVDEVARYAFAKVRECLGRLGRPDVLANVLGRNKDLKKWIRDP